MIYDAEPDIKTLVRHKSVGGETLGPFASYMDRPLISMGDNKTLRSMMPEVEKLTSYIEATKNHPDRNIGCCAYVVRVFWAVWNLLFLALGILIIIGAVWLLLQYRLDRIADPLSVTTEPLFFGIVVGAFMTVISFQGKFQTE